MKIIFTILLFLNLNNSLATLTYEVRCSSSNSLFGYDKIDDIIATSKEIATNEFCVNCKNGKYDNSCSHPYLNQVNAYCTNHEVWKNVNEEHMQLCLQPSWP